jgi:hypothetical protein
MSGISSRYKGLPLEDIEIVNRTEYQVSNVEHVHKPNQRLLRSYWSRFKMNKMDLLTTSTQRDITAFERFMFS